MANKQLKTLTFPGLTDTYIVNDDTIIAPQFVESEAHNVGALCTDGGNLYYCIKEAPANTAITNSEYFAKKSIADIIEMIKNGEIIVGKANLSNNFDSKMVLTDNSGYLYRTTGGALEVGEQNRVKKIIGASVPIIQLIDQPDLPAVGGLTITKNADKSYTINGTATESKYLYLTSINASAVGHKLWLKLKTSGTGNISIRNGSTSAYLTPNSIINVSGSIVYDAYIAEGEEFVNFKVYFELIELTQTFGTTVANRLYALEQAQAGTGVAKAKEILVKDYYPYNVTAFTHTKTSGKVNTGFNQFDINNANNKFTSDCTYTNGVISNKIVDGRSFVSLVVTAVKKDGTIQGLAAQTIVTTGKKTIVFTVPQNTSYVFFKHSGSTQDILFYKYYNFLEGMQYCTSFIVDGYNASVVNGVKFKEVNINFHWDGERDGEYEPYQEWNYPVQDIELKGILSLDAQDNWVADGDEYLPSGVVNGNWSDEQTVDANNVNAVSTVYPNIVYYSIPKPSAMKGYGSYSTVSINNNKGFSQYSIDDGADSVNNIGKYLTSANQNNIWFGFAIGTTLDQAKAILGGMKWYYPLATPTQTSADSYTELQNDSNWGTEKWIDTRDVPLPVFSTCEYIPDLKAKTETAPESPDEDGDYIMHRENGLNSYSSLAPWLGDNGYAPNVLPTAPAEDGTYTLKVTIADGEATYSWALDT